MDDEEDKHVMMFVDLFARLKMLLCKVTLKEEHPSTYRVDTSE